MPGPTTSQKFIELVRMSGLVDRARLEAYISELAAIPEQPKALSQSMVRDGVLTYFQAKQLLLGRYRGFNLGKYKILEQLGQGGMGAVYLCEHLLMRRRVAIKILPQDKASDPASLERFYREARAVAALDHPNIVRAHDIDQEGHLHFLVMEYVDGHSLQDIVKKHGPMDVLRSTHYMRQAAIGLGHLHEAGLVHRDIKPGNLLLDRQGIIKILDMGLARSFREGAESVTKLFDEKSVLGTADYLAPEQAMCSTEVDIRADIYSLGATWYYLLTGRAPFEEGTITQKLLWHQMRHPPPVSSLRTDVPAELAAVLEKMMAKDPTERFQEPKAVAEVLEPLTRATIPLPPDNEMPHLCSAARTAAGAEGSFAPLPTALTAGPISSTKHLPAASAASNSGGPRSSKSVQLDARLAQTATVGGTSSSGRLSHGSGPRSSTQPLSRVPRGSPAPDTDGPSAHSDTRPSSSTRLGQGHRRKRRGIDPDLLRKYRTWIYIGAGALAVFVIGLVAIIYSLLSIANPDNQRRAAAANNAVISLVHKSSGEQVNVKTLNDALNLAEPGDRIVVKSANGQPPILEDRLIANGGGAQGGPAAPGTAPSRPNRERRDVTVEADPELRAPIRWTPRPNLDQTTPLIYIASYPGLRLKGFVIDGQNRLQDLIQVQQNSPGLMLENIELVRFTSAGIRISNASGTAEKPMTIREVAIEGTANAAAIAFGSNDPAASAPDPSAIDRAPANQQAQQQLREMATQASQFIRIENCVFKGPFRATVEAREGIAEVEFVRNRFFRANDAFLIHKTTPLRRAQMLVDSNTFCEAKNVFHLESVAPGDPGNQIRIRNNLFVGAGTLVTSDSRSPEPAGVRAQWIWMNERDPLRDAPKGQRFFRKTFAFSGTPKSAVLDAFCDDACKVWFNNAAVGEADMAKNPTKIWAFDVTAHLRPGVNLIAVEGINRQGPAGLLVRLRILGADGNTTTIATDDSWKVSEQAPEGWQALEFKADSWPKPRLLANYGGGIEKWRNLVWEGIEPERFREINPPLVTALAGNVRDAATADGSFKLNIPVREITVGTDPRNLREFLRYADNSPLAHAGADGQAVGYPPY